MSQSSEFHPLLLVTCTSLKARHYYIEIITRQEPPRDSETIKAGRSKKSSSRMSLPLLTATFGGCKSTFGVSSMRFDRNSGLLVSIPPKEPECGKK